MDVQGLIKIRRLVATGAARAIREEAGLSLAEVADQVGVHRTTIHKWERQRRRCRGEAAIRYLNLLEELAGR